MNQVSTQIMNAMSEYSSAFIVIGYSLDGESFMVRSYETEKDQAALHALLEGVLDMDDVEEYEE